MRTPALILSVLASALVGGPARAQDKPSKEAVEASARKVKELRTERVTTLRQAADVSIRLARNGRSEIWEAMEDRMALLEGELGLAATEVERIALCTKAVEGLKEYEALAKTRLEAARGTELAVLRIRARRLEVETRLEEAKIRAGK